MGGGGCVTWDAKRDTCCLPPPPARVSALPSRWCRTVLYIQYTHMYIHIYAFTSTHLCIMLHRTDAVPHTESPILPPHASQHQRSLLRHSHSFFSLLRLRLRLLGCSRTPTRAGRARPVARVIRDPITDGMGGRSASASASVSVSVQCWHGGQAGGRAGGHSNPPHALDRSPV